MSTAAEAMSLRPVSRYVPTLHNHRLRLAPGSVKVRSAHKTARIVVAAVPVRLEPRRSPRVSVSQDLGHDPSRYALFVCIVETGRATTISAG